MSNYPKPQPLLVRALRVRDGDNCSLCGELLNFNVKGNKRRAVSIDHVIPRALGGGDNIENLRLAHRDCNIRRGHGLPPRTQPLRVAEWDNWSSARRNYK